MRGLVKHALVSAAVFAYRRMDGGRATLLNYHRFPAQYAESFRRQCAYLRRNCHVLGMSDFTARLRGGVKLPAHAAVITVDDGHRDFYTCAYPILREFGLPSTMYLPTAFMDGAWLWFDRYRYIFESTAMERAEIRGLPPLKDAILGLGSSAARDAAFYEIAMQAQWLPAGERDRLGGCLAEALAVSMPDRPAAGFAPATWDEVREMARNGVEFGGHTVTHPILGTVKAAEDMAREIGGCKARIEQELQGEVRHFAYPSGRMEEIPAEAAAAVASAGFETAVTTMPGRVGPGDDRLWLRRVPVGPEVDPLWFRRGVAAVRIA